MRDDKGYFIEVEHSGSAMPQKVYIANPNDWYWHAEGPRYRTLGDGLYLFQFGAYGWTQIAVWEGSFQDAWDEAGEWLRDHAPGLLVTPEDQGELMDEVAEERGLKISDLSWDTDNEKLSGIEEKALVDLAPIGGYGDYIRSWEAHGHEENPDTATYRRVLVESVRACVEDDDVLDDQQSEAYRKALKASRTVEHRV